MTAPDHLGYDGVILAAGRGTRMTPFSERYPKPLLPILNRPLMHHHVDFLKKLGVTRVFVVIGHLGHEIALSLGRGEQFGVQIEYVEQRDSLGIAHAAMQLESHITRPFLLLLGDIYFESNTQVNPFEQMQRHHADGFLAVMNEPDHNAIRRNYAVDLDDSGRVHRVFEKPRFPRTHWKGSGFYAFDVSFFDAIRRTPRTAGRNEYELTDAIQIYIDDGAKVIAGDIMTCDINLTFPYDVLAANLQALRRRGLPNVISPSARVHPQAVLQDCVIGDGAVVDAPLTLRRSVLMPNALVSTLEPVDRAVVTPDRIVDCKYWIDPEGRLIDPAAK